MFRNAACWTYKSRPVASEQNINCAATYWYIWTRVHIHQNAKIETLWNTVEGQLLAMLESVADLTLAFLNEATQAWAEFGYNRALHSEIGATPLARWAAGPDVLRPSPDSAALRLTLARP